MRSSTRTVGPALVVLTCALAACAAPRESLEDAETPGPKRVGVSQSLETYLVEFEPDETQLSRDNRVALRAFLRAIDAGQRDRIALVTDHAADGERTARRQRAVAEFLRRSGYQDISSRAGKDVDTSGYESLRNPGVLVQVLHYRADLSDCPDLSRTRLGGFANLTSSNFGCATARNLGLMVAEPRDLSEGRDPGGADGERMGEALKRYRKGEVKTGTDLQTEITGDGG